MLSLHTNAASLSAQNSVGRTQNSLSTSMTRLSTGFRINSASDDAAGLQIATRLKAQTSGMAVAMRNTQNSVSMLQTAEGALGEVTNILTRMKDLATQSSDGASTGADKTAMQSEYDALSSELSNIVGNTSFGGSKLLTKAADPTGTALSDAETAFSTAKSASDAAASDYATKKTAADLPAATAAQKAEAAAALVLWESTASTTTAAASSLAAASTPDGKLATALTFQIGASSSETMSFDLSTQLTGMHDALGATSDKYTTYGASTTTTGTELTAPGSASAIIDKLQTAIESVGSVRSSMGAAANRLEHVHANLANVSANTEAAAGRIMDVDFATESSKMTQSQMLMQAGTAMLKQTNQMSSMVMSLLQ